MNTNLTTEVESIGSISFEGNIIPMEWFNHILCDSGKPDAIAIMILSDIVYWYRPTIIRNESTGAIIGYRKKFKADLLQRSYTDLEKQFGFSRSQIKDALKRLEKNGLLLRIFRNISNHGSTIANVMFLKPFPEKIKIITQSKELGMKNFLHTSEEISSEVCGLIATPQLINHHTYTETTTKITTKNSLSTKQNQKPNLSLAKKNNERESEMIKIWNDVIEKQLGREINYTSNRGKLLNKRLKDFFNDDLSKWNEFCQKIVKSKFLMGEKTDFRIQLDWVLEEANLVKVLEGSYNRAEEIITQNNDEVYTKQELMSEIQKSDTPEFWKQLMILLMKEKGTATFKSWIIKNQYSSFKNGVLEIKAFSQFGKSWVTTHYFDDIVNVCKKILPDFKELKIIY